MGRCSLAVFVVFLNESFVLLVFECLDIPVFLSFKCVAFVIAMQPFLIKASNVLNYFTYIISFDCSASTCISHIDFLETDLLSI